VDDVDADGVPNFEDLDSDDDGRIDGEPEDPRFVDSDEDGIPDIWDNDSDNDGIPDSSF
jgi:heat shock protein beta